MTLRRRVSRASNRLKTLDHRHFDRAFLISSLLFVALILVLTPNYSPRGQLFPLVIGVPTFVLSVALLVIQSSARFQSLVRKYTVTELFDKDALSDRQAADDAESPGTDDKSVVEERTDVLLISLWIAALLGIVYLFGLLPGSLVFLLVYYRISARQSFPKAVAYSVLVWLFLLVIFRLLLGAPLYTGVFTIELPSI